MIAGVAAGNPNFSHLDIDYEKLTNGEIEGSPAFARSPGGVAFLRALARLRLRFSAWRRQSVQGQMQ